MTRISTWIASLVICGLSMCAHASVMWQVDSLGQLTGATGVEVSGTLYDVQFVEGSCINIFNGCDAPSDFLFNTITSAMNASQALMDQVLLDNSYGSFDTHPDLTSGCSSSGYCYVLTPFSVDFHGVNANRAENGIYANFQDGVGFDGISPVYDVGNDPASTYAQWSLHSDPEPGTFALLSLGLVAGFGVHRRHSRAGGNA